MTLQLTCSCSGRYIFHDRREGPICSKCHSQATMAPLPASHYQQLDIDYACPITDKPIRSKHAHEENLRIHGKQVYEPGVEKDAARNRERINQEFEDKLCETAAQFVAQLPSEAKLQLEKELLTNEIQTTRGTL